MLYFKGEHVALLDENKIGEKRSQAQVWAPRLPSKLPNTSHIHLTSS